MNIAFESLETDDIEAAFDLCTRVFVEGSVLHSTLGVGLDSYRRYLRKNFFTTARMGLSVIARDTVTNVITGCALSGPFDYSNASNMPTQTHKETLETVLPISALIHALRRQYSESLEGVKKHCLVDMAVVDPDWRSRGIYATLRELAEDRAREAGFDYINGELSSAATQHVCINRLGHRLAAGITLREFEYRHTRPFQNVESPDQIVLVEKRL